MCLTCVTHRSSWSDLKDQHILSEVVPQFEDDAQGWGGGGGRHGLELQPQRLLLGRHHLAALKLGWGGVQVRAEIYI